MRRRRTQRGSLLVITLWMVAILSAFAIAIARYLSVELRVMKYRLARAQADAIARSGVYVAMRRLAFDGTHGDEPYDWLGDPDWAFVQGDGAEPSDRWEVRAAGTVVDASGQLNRGARAWVAITDEERKVNLNQVPTDPAALKAVSAWLRSEELAARLVDYLDVDTAPSVVSGTSTAGLEADMSADPPYSAKNAPAAAHEELLTIPGMAAVPASDMIAFRDLTSVHYGPQAKMNVNTVGADALRALGVGEATTSALVQFRDGPDGPQAHDQDGVFDQEGPGIVQTLAAQHWSVAEPQKTNDETLLAAMGVSSGTFTVDSTGEVPIPSGRAGAALVSARVRAVVRRKGCGQGMPDPCIVAWNEW